MKDHFIIALGGLRKRFLRTSLTMLGIFIGIAAVVALISLGQGFLGMVAIATRGTEYTNSHGESAPIHRSSALYQIL